MLETEKHNHVVYRIAYHLCWIPKYRKKVFTKELRGEMKKILSLISYEYEWDIKEVEVMEDHIHVLIKASPKWSPSRIVQTLKSKSAIEFFKKHPEIRREYFWGGKLWTSSYFCETVGNSSYERIKKYVKDQQKEEEARLKKLKLFE